MNRLQVRLDEEEFGLAEAPVATTPSAASVAAVSSPGTVEKEPEKETPVVETKPDPPAAAEGDPKAAEEPKESSPTTTKTEPAVGKAVSTKGMTLEEKKKARAARFGTVAPSNSTKKNNSRKRERGTRGEGKDPKKKKDEGGGKTKNTMEKKGKANIFDSLTKDELEKRLERAKKYGVVNETVDAMKIALRKFRFEGK